IEIYVQIRAVRLFLPEPDGFRRQGKEGFSERTRVGALGETLVVCGGKRRRKKIGETVHQVTARRAVGIVRIAGAGGQPLTGAEEHVEILVARMQPGWPGSHERARRQKPVVVAGVE